MLDKFSEIEKIIEELRYTIGMDYGSFNLLVLRDEDGIVVRYYIVESHEDVTFLSDEIKYICDLYSLRAEIDIRFRTFSKSKTHLYKKLYSEVKENGEGYKSKHQRKNIEDVIIESITGSKTVEWQKINVVKADKDKLIDIKSLINQKRYILLSQYSFEEQEYIIVDNTNKRTFKDLFSEYGEVLGECYLPIYQGK